MLGIELVEIRSLREEEVAVLEQHFPSGRVQKHQDRMVKQRRGEVVYLIAWLDRQPVGHGLIKLLGVRTEPIATWSNHCPYIMDLLVAEAWRSRGLGTRLLEAAEQVVWERGFDQVGLSVAADNLRARAFYTRCGYLDSELGEYPTTGSYVNAEGKTRTWYDMSVYLLKKMRVAS